MMMRTVITAVAVTAVLATTSFAQTRRHVTPHKPDINSYGSYGTYVPRTTNRSRAARDIRGNYVGRDPDRTVRQQLRRDPTQGD
jgi:hypothetical protein